MLSTGAAGEEPVRRVNLLRLALLLVLGAAIAWSLLYRGDLDAATVEHWVQQAGTAAPAAFVVLYALGTVLFLPGSVLALAGGALFGPFWGIFYNLGGATLGASAAFLIARYLGASWVERRVGGKLQQLIQGAESEGWRFVAFVRLVPLFPFNLLNYALGLTRVRFLHYLVATYVFMLPGSIAFTYVGYAGREVVAGQQGLIRKVLLALALLAAAAFLPRLVSRLRRGPSLNVEALKSRLDKQQDLLVLDVRPPADYVGDLGHIAGSRNIPLAELESRIDELYPYLERPIAVVCRTDRSSAKAAQSLSGRGFADVHVVIGGMSAWNRAGWAVTRDPARNE
jgi:uncharacterized membrane protein YdjX (TVP38/TMEM64 family)/rhodanese-related sulfurtransferase